MAMTEAERKRLSRERQRQARRAAIRETTKAPRYLASSFADHMRERELDLFENLDAFGVFILGTLFDDDQQNFPSQVAREEPLTALERAVGIVDVLIDAARELAEQINSYKLTEVERAIDAAVQANAELPRGDVEALRQSLAEIDRLKAIRSELRTPTRQTVAAIRSRGE